MTQDYQSPIQPGKNIVVGQAAILWGEAFTHPDKGRIDGGWILPGMVRTTNGEHAARVCRELNESIKAATRAKPLPTTVETIGESIARQLRELR
jgi:hypothetical protein